MAGYMFLCSAFVIISSIYLSNGQLPPRLQIPGALLVSRPQQQRLQRPIQPLSDSSLPPKLRKPIPNVFPVAIPIREEAEDSNSGLSDDDEPPKLNISPISQSRVENDNDEEPIPRPIPFRPERPLAIARQEIPSPPPRPILRQNIGEDILPGRQSIPQARRLPPQPVRQTIKPQPRPPPSEYLNADDNRRNRNRKPPVQILRKYRTDNEDGSITWGFENEDGTFKEENIGTDCVIRGKYGYIDPEGTKREYVYETGNKCDQREEELPVEETPLQPNIPNRPNNLIKRPVARVPL